MSARIRALDGSGLGVEPRSALLPIPPTALDILLGLPVPALLLWGPSGIALYNDACAAFIGELHPGLLGSSVLQTWPQEAEFYTRALELGLREESLVAKNRELWLERQGHRHSVRVDLTSSPVRDVAGKPAGVLVTLSERAERAADAGWAAAAEEGTSVLSEVPVALLVVEGPEHVIRFVNPAYRSIFGDRPLLGLPLRQAFPDPQGSAVLQLPDQVYRTGDMLRATELPLTLDRRGDGSREQGYFDVVWSALRDAEDRITGLMAVTLDVTEQVRLGASSIEPTPSSRRAAPSVPSSSRAPTPCWAAPTPCWPPRSPSACARSAIVRNCCGSSPALRKTSNAVSLVICTIRWGRR
jgi:PAS domain-containing protein